MDAEDWRTLPDPKENTCWIHPSSGTRALVWQCLDEGICLRIPNMKDGKLDVSRKVFHTHWRPWDAAATADGPNDAAKVICDLLDQCEYLQRQLHSYLRDWHENREHIARLEKRIKELSPP